MSKSYFDLSKIYKKFFYIKYIQNAKENSIYMKIFFS